MFPEKKQNQPLNNIPLWKDKEEKRNIILWIIIFALFIIGILFFSSLTSASISSEYKYIRNSNITNPVSIDIYIPQTDFVSFFDNAGTSFYRYTLEKPDEEVILSGACEDGGYFDNFSFATSTDLPFGSYTYSIIREYSDYECLIPTEQKFFLEGSIGLDNIFTVTSTPTSTPTSTEATSTIFLVWKNGEMWFAIFCFLVVFIFFARFIWK